MNNMVHLAASEVAWNTAFNVREMEFRKYTRDEQLSCIFKLFCNLLGHTVTFYVESDIYGSIAVAIVEFPRKTIPIVLRDNDIDI